MLNQNCIMKISLAPDVVVNAGIRHGAPSEKIKNCLNELGSESSDMGVQNVL